MLARTPAFYASERRYRLIATRSDTVLAKVDE